MKDRDVDGVLRLTDDPCIVAGPQGTQVIHKQAFAATWIRRDGRWLCALHTESILGDPFGRDRRPAK